MAKRKPWKAFFSGKRVTQMGLGLLGRGVKVAEFLAENGAELIVTDLKSAEELKPSIEALSRFPNIQFVLGEHRLEDFRNRDLIIKGPNVPLKSSYIAEARKRRIPIEMDASLFVKLSPATIIGITGSRGKSTVTHLLYSILKKTKKRVYLGGNIQGIATLPLLKKVKKGDIVVMELDSWQLQGFGDSKMSPHIAVFTSFMPDHLNYYGGSMERYFDDKANIFRFHKPRDFFVAGRQMLHRLEKGMVKGRFITVDEGDIPKDWKLKIPGIHNRYNAALASAVAKLFKVREWMIRRAVQSFRGVPGRLQLLRKFKGVSIWNDTTATTPEATIAGLQALHGKGNIVLIGGGTEKGLPVDRLIKEINFRVKTLVLLPGSGTNQIKEGITIPSKEVSSLGEAVKEAIETAGKGDAILFSPGFTSFGLFKNEYDRGEQFEAIVNSL